METQPVHVPNLCGNLSSSKNSTIVLPLDLSRFLELYHFIFTINFCLTSAIFSLAANSLKTLVTLTIE